MIIHKEKRYVITPENISTLCYDLSLSSGSKTTRDCLGRKVVRMAAWHSTSRFGLCVAAQAGAWTCLVLVDVAKAETCHELTCYQFGRGAMNVEIILRKATFLLKIGFDLSNSFFNSCCR